jgi:hypothetical protein
MQLVQIGQPLVLTVKQLIEQMAARQAGLCATGLLLESGPGAPWLHNPPRFAQPHTRH